MLDLPAAGWFSVAGIAQTGAKVAHVALEADDLGVVVEGDALVAVHALDEGVEQPLGVRSLGGPVEVAQVATQLVCLLDQEDVVALVGDGQGRGHARQARRR